MSAVVIGAWVGHPRTRYDTIYLNVRTRAVSRRFDLMEPPVVVHLPPQEFSIAVALLARYPGSVTADEQAEHLYRHRSDGGPDYARSNTGVLRARLRRHLAPLGISITGRGWAFGQQAVIR